MFTSVRQAAAIILVFLLAQSFSLVALDLVFGYHNGLALLSAIIGVAVAWRAKKSMDQGKT